MKTLLAAFLLICSFLSLQAQSEDASKRKPFQLPEGITSKDFIPNVIILKLKPLEKPSAKTFSSRQVPVIKSSSVISIVKKFPESESFARTSARGRVDNAGLDRIYELRITSSSNIETVINELLADPAVEYAEPSYINHINYIPNDPLYPQQPYLQQIQAPLAWNLIRNVPGVILAVVDSGSELTHPDLAANIYLNSSDPVNGVDDDGNGKVDDYRGWDFVGSSGTNIQEDNNPNVVGPSNDHGVHVSGIAGARTDNGLGVASVSFNCAKLLIVKAGPDDSGTDILRGYEGIKYAADRGAQIINCSWGSKGRSGFGRDIIDYAISKGCLIVAAAGNTGSSIPEYPAAYRGVMAVANTQNDVIASSSSYGDHVAIAAPGTSILSTTFNSTYNLSTGTSMSTPVVASAASLVKAYLPTLTMSQVGELLRVTADNIDSKNPTLIGQFGKGRLNVYRALTENPPSVRVQKITEDVRAASIPSNPDTLYLYLDIRNFLFPVNNLKLTLSSGNSEIAVIDPSITVPALATLETKTLVGPFKVLIPNSVATNTDVSFRLDYTANNNSYQDYESFSVVVAKDYLDVSTPFITSTITSNGRIGFGAPDAEGGSGFLYKDEQLLYEASLMIGNSSTRVSNNARSVNDQSDDHFIKLVEAHELANNADSVRAESEFDDSGNPNRLNVRLKHAMIGYKRSPDNKYVIAEYQIYNTTNFDLFNIHVGLFVDMDIFGGSTNATQFDAANRLAYVYDKVKAGPYGAVKLLNQNAPSIYYPLSYNLNGNPLSDSDLTIEEKWETLSNGVQSLGMGTSGSGVDVSFVCGNGPYVIPANGSIKVAFAMIGGDDLQDVQTSAAAAQQKYNQITVPAENEIAKSLDIKVFINPSSASEGDLNIVRLELPEEGTVSLELYNLAGQKVRTLVSRQPYPGGVHYLQYNLGEGFFADVTSGIYFYKLNFNNSSRSAKTRVLR